MGKFMIWIYMLPIAISAQVEVSSFDRNNPVRALEQAMKSHYDTLVIDDHFAVWELSPMTFFGIRNKVILLEEDVALRAARGKFGDLNASLLKFIDCENISILGTGNEISMNKDEYTRGEWRHTLTIRGCRNFRIKGLVLRDSGGDGIFLGHSKKFRMSRDVRIEDVQCINNKRQGMSIISASGVLVTNSVFRNTIGSLPGAGVDIEPNIPQDVISNIRFEDCVFTENFHAGIKLALDKLTAESERVSIEFVRCELSNNFSRENSRRPAEIYIVANRLQPVQGSVRFLDCAITASDWGVLYARNNLNGVTVTFDKFSAKSILGQGDTALFTFVNNSPQGVDGYFESYGFNDFYCELPNDQKLFAFSGRESLQKTQSGVLTGALNLSFHGPAGVAGCNGVFGSVDPTWFENLELVCKD